MFFQGNEKYNCATYLRLSRSDGDQQESNSIKNQRALLNDYMGKHPELHKFDEYVDDGYSGTNFERPDFKRMMQDIEKRNVNCIIVKDLSRFGRNYIETGRYLERIFPFMGVRFIAINDHYDSAEENDDKGRILIPFNNLINDTYCRDISLRVRSHLDVKRKEGQFIGSFAGYGYRKDPKDKNHLIIDEYAAGIVQEIFKQKLNGMSSQRIASHLNELGVLPPNEYKRANGFNYTCGFQAGRIAQKTDGALIGNIDQFIGKVNEILFVVYTERVRIEENGSKTDVTRLISARMATEFERGLYYGKNE